MIDIELQRESKQIISINDIKKKLYMYIKYREIDRKIDKQKISMPNADIDSQIYMQRQIDGQKRKIDIEIENSKKGIMYVQIER